MKILLGCGAAAAIAATFNTPIAGVLFAIELILMEFKTRSFVPLVIASVIATLWAPGFDALLTGSWEGNPWQANPAFKVPEFTLAGPWEQVAWELVAYLGLGILCGVVALFFINVLYGTEDLFNRTRLPPWGRPALGGLLLGCVGIAFPAVYGVGYEHVESIINIVEEPTFAMVVIFGLLALVKVVGVSLTLGSGGSGGVFAPALFIGCMTGAFFGAVLHFYRPDISIGAFALVGMAATVAATTRGTLTAIIMIFEMTRVYDIVLPLLFACVIADMVASFGSPETIYTRKLLRRGIRIVHDLEPNVMQLFTVREVMVPLEDVITIGPEDQLHKVVYIVRRTGHNGFPVLDEMDNLVGVVTHEDVRNAQHEGNLFLKAKELMTTDMISVTPYETGEVALRRMGDRRISHLPVVDPYDTTKLMGWISKGDVVFAYEDYHRRMEEPFKKYEGEVRSGTEEGPETPEKASVPVPFLHRLFGRKKEGPADISYVPTIEISSEEDLPLEVGEVVDLERPDQE
jgi:CIC family chloride channel protein